ncbi:MAG: S8 family serine peptidase [Dehalococcoidia bacterium]|nr:S8 family serine peptidase [Dehalococcoidia bacterium]
MRRVVLLVVLLGLGVTLIGNARFDSGSSAGASEERTASSTASQAATVDRATLDSVLAGLARAPSSVIAANDAIGADRWQVAGFTGYGVRVAIVDTGFDGYQSQLGVTLPGTVHARSFRADGRLESGSEHGTLAARIVHSIAPRADLYLANFSTVEEFSNLVAYLQAEQVQVVSFSLGFVHNGPGDGTGPVDDIIGRSVASGQLWTVAAGNWAQQHWSGTFTDRDGNGINDFAPGVEDNGRAYQAGDLITVSLRWDDSWGFACTDYDLELFGPDGALAAASRGSQACLGNPVESVQVLATKTGRYRVRIVQVGSSGRTPRLDLLMLGAPDRSQPLDYFVTAGSLAEPADHAGVVTVGAENPFDNALVANFSSVGPTQDGRPKPDLVAPTGRATGGEVTFSGTSAATPHVAGAAALLFEALPGAGAAQVAQELRTRGGAAPAGGTGSTARSLQLGGLEGVGPVLPPGDGLASLVGPTPEGPGVATLQYRGPDQFPARFSHLLLGGRSPSAFYRANAAGRFEAFIVGAPRVADTFEVFRDGDIVLAVYR